MGSASSFMNSKKKALQKQQQVNGQVSGAIKLQSGPTPSAADQKPSKAPPAEHASGSSTDDSAPGTEYTGSVAPYNEPERWNYLCNLSVLDTEPEQRFDDITRLCCMIFKVPIALVSLVDKERQWFKSVQGLPVRETDRRSSFCAWTLLPQHPEVLVVENALEDIRFRDNPLVLGSPDIRFYAGCPLVATNRHRLGSLCVIDRKPRQFDADSCNMLANMAEMVVREIEKEKMLELQKQRSVALSQENTQLLRAIDCFSEAIILCNMSLPRWPIVFINESFEKLTQVDRVVALEKGFWDLFQIPPEHADKYRAQYSRAISHEEGFSMAVYLSLPSGTTVRFNTAFRCANRESIDSHMPDIGIPSILPAGGAGRPGGAGGGPCYYFGIVQQQQQGRQDREAGRNSGSSETSVTVLKTKLDPFEDVKLGHLLGTGAYGRVYRGQWNGAQVAVKVLEHVATGDGSDILEALLSGQVSHPNIVQTYKYCSRSMPTVSKADDDDDERQRQQMMETWMVMEFCNKGSLSDAVDRGRFRKNHSLFEVDFKAVLETAKEVAGAMTYLHNRGILHGDLTGNNILLMSSEKDARKFAAKVADFGLSRVLDSNQAITTKTYGTVTHMPPELLLDGTLSMAADVYAFGVLMWEMYMGQRPYAGMSHGQIIHSVTSGKPLALGPSTPVPYKQFVNKCYDPDPAKRPTFARIIELLEELEQDLV